MMKIRHKPWIAALGALFASTSTQAQTLAETVQETIKTNPDIYIQTSDRLAVEQELRQARAGYYPTVDVNAGIGRERSDNPTTRANGNDEVTLTRQEAGVMIRQNLFDGFSTTYEVERQKARVDSRAHRVSSISENTALNAVEAHIDVMRRLELVRLAEQNLENHKKTYERIKLRSQRGVDGRADTDQALGRMSLANSNYLVEKSNLRDAEIAYLRIVGVEPKDMIEPPRPYDQMPPNLVAATDDAKANHPTLKSAEKDLEAARSQHKVARSPYFPRVDLELSATADEDVDGIEGDNEDAAAMLRLRYNLYNGGRDRARRRETAHRITEAKEIRDRTCRQVVEGMRLSWNAYRYIRGRLQHLKEHVRSSAAARAAYQEQFNLGRRTLLDLLDAENEVFQAETAYINARYDELFAMYRILNSKGKLLEALEIAPPQEAKTLK